MVEALASEGVIEGVKATVSDSSYIVSLSRVKERVEDFTLFSGIAEVLPLALAHGWDGAVDALANVAPGITLGMLHAWRDGDTKKLSKLARIAARASQALRPYGLQGGLKALLAEMGAPISRAVRPPLTTPPDTIVKAVKNLLCNGSKEVLLPGLKC